MNMVEIGKKAKAASYELANVNTNIKNKALSYIKEELLKNKAEIIAANEKDINAAKDNGIKDSMVDRLRLDFDRIDAMAAAIDKVIGLPDPAGLVTGGGARPNGMEIVKKRVPLGVVGIIFESRPNVTIDAGILCLKSGNACILRGGKEAINSNLELARIMRTALKKASLPADCIQVLEDTDRKYVKEMAELTDYIDALIPRGSAGLINTIKNLAKVPFIETGAGNCHIYIDYDCNEEMAIAITDNGKTQRPSVCNALETLLIHELVADDLLPKIYDKLSAHSVEIRGDETTLEILGGKAKKATSEDYETEYNDYIMAVKVVENIEEAIEHINKYSTGHSEVIVTDDYENSNKFTKGVDSACVYVNASTRFTDGEEFGLGAEIGISTQKLHARGPMGLEELTTDKYIITGDGQIR